MHRSIVVIGPEHNYLLLHFSPFQIGSEHHMALGQGTAQKKHFGYLNHHSKSSEYLQALRMYTPRPKSSTSVLEDLEPPQEEIGDQ